MNKLFELLRFDYYKWVGLFWLKNMEKLIEYLILGKLSKYKKSSVKGEFYKINKLSMISK